MTSKNVEMPQCNLKDKPISIIQDQDPDDGDQMGGRRASIEIFTDDFVETLTDKPPRYEYGSQTEGSMSQMVARHRMPTKVGVDMYTNPDAAKPRSGTTNCSTSTTRWNHYWECWWPAPSKSAEWKSCRNKNCS